MSSSTGRKRWKPQRVDGCAWSQFPVPTTPTLLQPRPSLPSFPHPCLKSAIKTGLRLGSCISAITNPSGCLHLRLAVFTRNSSTADVQVDLRLSRSCVHPAPLLNQTLPQMPSYRSPQLMGFYLDVTNSFLEVPGWIPVSADRLLSWIFSSAQYQPCAL